MISRIIYTSVLCVLFFVSTGFAQKYDPLSQPNTYRQNDNPNYWKNKMPFAGYWQQDVHYKIKAAVSEITDIIDAEEELTYWNNSPNDLNYVFFHIYQEAFQPNSYYDNLHKANKMPTFFGKYERKGSGTEISSFQIDGKDVKVEYDNTILKVYLPQPLKSGTSITFNIKFKTYFDTGSMRRRMKTFRSSGYKHYDGVHWYPRIAVYDRKFGWTTDQHLGREFYGDFGTFDVELTFASNYVLDATGSLLNRAEVLPDSLRAKLDISNFKDKPWGEPASVITPYDSTKRKTWKFHAENVHDFAFTADPTYRIGEANWNGIKCIALAREQHASRWQNAAEYTAQIIKTFSEDIGMYTYHKMIVADAKDGMEYPMLTLDGGSDPGYRGLFVHEIGHNWFFGQVGTNETYRAFMDEGFTQFLTAWGLEKIDGDTLVTNSPKGNYKQWFKKPDLVRERRVYYGYLHDAIREEDAPLNTHSDDFNGAIRHGGGYRHVYYKTATMLYNLQYVLGDELFLSAMQHYFSTWKIAHPYPEDFRNSIIQYTEVDLNWFFDQWLETTKTIDYKVQCVKKTSDDKYEITFKREGSMQMPIDFVVKDKRGEKHAYHIPNTWFEKETDAEILDRWIGWGKLNETYTAKVSVPNGLKDVEIDPSGRLADVNRMNNTKKCTSSLEFDHHLNNPIDRNNYQVFLRPDFWYNAYDGVKVGVHLNGNYMEYLHNFNFTAWLNSGLLQQNIFLDAEKLDYNVFSYRLDYQTPICKQFKGLTFWGESKFLDGLVGNNIGLELPSGDKHSSFSVYAKSLYRPSLTDLNYLWYPQEWNADQWNNSMNFRFTHNYDYLRGNGKVTLHSRTSGLGSDYNYSLLSLESVNKNNLESININTRFFVQYGFGTNWAPESQLYLAGANPEEMMDNKYMRSVGFFDPNWGGHGVETNHLHYGGGLNLRGYSGYLAADGLDSNQIALTYKGMSGAAFNMEMEFQEILPKIYALSRTFGLKTYLFGDIGLINKEDNDPTTFLLSSLRADAGIGAALTIKKFGPLETVKPLTIRADFPLFLNRIPAVESNYIDFRWIISVGRAF